MINEFIESGQNHTSAIIEEDPILDYQIRLTLDYKEDFGYSLQYLEYWAPSKG